MKLENGQNLQDHLKVFVELFEELAIIGDAMEEEERVIILLSSLPDRFSTLVTALEAHEKIPTCNCSDKCIGYLDADWAGDRSDRKSTSGYCFTLSNSVITWRSVKQSCVALSTAEAEYVALAGAAQEAIWLKQLLDDLEFKTGGPMVVNEDNQSAICLAQNPKYHGRSKHIDIKFHYVRDLVRKKEIDLVYCPSNDMLADIFTKGLSAEKFSRLRSKLGVVSFEKHIQCEKEC
ncbi:hypothetical protein FHG87_010554 [Trinorchestia longiramus]|nr:hypothetical protein FHG87_010554 [Trinorchestia longiramus]